MADYYDDAISAPLMNGYGWGSWFGGGSPYAADLSSPALAPSAIAPQVVPRSPIPPWIKRNSRGEPYNLDDVPGQQISAAQVTPDRMRDLAAANAAAPALTAAPGAPQPALSALPPAAQVAPPPGMDLSGKQGNYTMPELMQLAQQAGFTGDKVPMAASIAMAESSGNPFAKNEKGEHSYGLSQINADAWGPVAKSAYGNGLQAMNLMYKISKGGEDFSPWSMFKNGGYKKFLPPLGTARNDVALAAGGGTPDAPLAASPAPASGGSMPPAMAAFGAGGSGGGSSGVNLAQQLLQLKKLTAQSPSDMLARMAQGFLGGKGPAASLAGGFGAMANPQKSNDPASLLRTVMAMQALGLKTTNASQEMARKDFTAMVNAGVPTATAAAASGFKLPGADNASTAASDVHGDDYLKNLDPSTASQVKALAEGRMQFPGGFALKSPYWQNMLRSVSQYDPGFDAVNYNARNATRKDFTSGKSAQAVSSFNTAIGHLGTLQQAGEALQNGDYPLINQGRNLYRDNTGDPRVKSFDVARQAVADELTRAFRLSGGNLHDIEGWEKSINAASSPEQLKATIQQAVTLLSSRIGAVGDQYKRGMGTTAQPITLLTDHAKQTLATLPGGSDLIQELGGQPPAAAGPVGGIPGQVGGALPALTATGPNGQKLRLVNGRWVPF